MLCVCDFTLMSPTWFAYKKIFRHYIIKVLLYSILGNFSCNFSQILLGRCDTSFINHCVFYFHCNLLFHGNFSCKFVTALWTLSRIISRFYLVTAIWEIPWDSIASAWTHALLYLRCERLCESFSDGRENANSLSKIEERIYRLGRGRKKCRRGCKNSWFEWRYKR